MNKISKLGGIKIIQQILFTSAIILLFNFQGLGQNSSAPDSLFISAIILNKENSEPIPYATIYNQSSKKGTITNLNGFFSLENISINDALTISFVGFEKKHILITKSVLNQTIYLIPKTELLSEVTILADNSFLYNLIHNAKKTQTNKPKNAKTHYVLQSMIGNKQMELVECYYNGEFAGYDTKNLNLKNGRIALADFNNRFFISTESSKAMYMHRLFYTNEYFPISPFQLRKNQLKSKYDLSLVSKYLNKDSTTTYVINFTPKNHQEKYFSGRVWLNSDYGNIIKVNLNAENVSIHPFIPHGNAKSIKKVNINLSKTYQLIDFSSYVNSIDFNYQITYNTMEDSSYSVNTSAVLYAYDYKNEFILPKFNFSNGMYEDYRKINATPYNPFFWDNIDEFKIKNIARKNDYFIKRKSSITNQTLFLNNSFFEKGMFEHPYVFWSKNRVEFRESSFDSKNNKSNLGMMPSDLYHLEAQIFLDVNELNDSLNYITKTIFDPFKSYYYFPKTNEGLAFINMYFDLIEINRRKLEEAFRKEKNAESIIQSYNQKHIEFENTIKQFFKEVEHGTNENAMLKWNQIIRKELGIDNIAIFGLYFID